MSAMLMALVLVVMKMTMVMWMLPFVRTVAVTL